MGRGYSRSPKRSKRSRSRSRSGGGKSRRDDRRSRSRSGGGRDKKTGRRDRSRSRSRDRGRPMSPAPSSATNGGDQKRAAAMTALVEEETAKRLETEIKKRVAECVNSDLFLAALQKKIDSARAALTEKMLGEVEREVAAEKSTRLATAIAALEAISAQPLPLADPPPPPPDDDYPPHHPADPTAYPNHAYPPHAYPNHAADPYAAAAAHPQLPLPPSSLSLPPPPPPEDPRIAQEAALKAQQEEEERLRMEEERLRMDHLEKLQEKARASEEQRRKEKDDNEVKKKQQQLILGKGSKGEKSRTKLSFGFVKAK